MLSFLRITNLAILEDVSLEPGPGFNVLTGETGAGKSIVVDAIGLLLGSRGGPDLIRAGADRLTVEGQLDLSGRAGAAALLAAAGLEPSDAPDGELGQDEPGDLDVDRLVRRQAEVLDQLRADDLRHDRPRRELRRDHQGGEYELLNKCSCVIDRLSEEYGYDDFVEAQTMAKGVTIAGERGGALRDNEQAQKEARAYRGAYKQAAEQCFLR